MSLNKKLLASAIVAGLAISANAQAAINLGVDDPLVFASELDDGTALATTADDIDVTIGYNFSNGEVRYGRFECSENMTMDSVTLTEGGGNVTLGAINGEGTSALFFSMTGNGAVSDADTISFVSNNTLEDGGTVSCSFSIYDQPSQAQAGGATGRIYTTGESDVITRASGFTFEMNAAGASGPVAEPTIAMPVAFVARPSPTLSSAPATYFSSSTSRLIIPFCMLRTLSKINRRRQELPHRRRSWPRPRSP